VDAGVLDPARVKPLDRQHEDGARDVEGRVMEAAGLRSCLTPAARGRIIITPETAARIR
jgi:hypothetical protein